MIIGECVFNPAIKWTTGVSCSVCADPDTATHLMYVKNPVPHIEENSHQWFVCNDCIGEYFEHTGMIPTINKNSPSGWQMTCNIPVDDDGGFENLKAEEEMAGERMYLEQLEVVYMD